MTAQKGKDLLIKIDDGGSYVTIAGLRARRLAFNAEAVDITDAESAGRWRELLGGAGMQRASLSGGGLFKDQASDALRHYQSLPSTRPPGVNSRVVDAAHGGAPIPGLPQAKVWYRTSETVGGDDPAEMDDDPAEMDDDDDDSAPFDEAVDGP